MKERISAHVLQDNEQQGGKREQQTKNIPFRIEEWKLNGMIKKQAALNKAACFFHQIKKRDARAIPVIAPRATPYAAPYPYPYPYPPK